MKIQFKPIFNSWVAVHPNPIGVVEFIGGAGFGMLPNITYSHLLHSFYDTGYTVIAVPFPLGLNHRRIAEGLAEERDRIRASLGYGNNTPHFWVGHSLGCKYILLLEATGKSAISPRCC
ncbi:MAG: DUF1350 family protein [Coleofasciculaceae cyanobacterium SM2_3_26]|nr:DUF1350 family protein [Coleofasciculaceae cyanobacterium SM2_3_26]